MRVLTRMNLFVAFLCVFFYGTCIAIGNELDNEIEADDKFPAKIGEKPGNEKEQALAKIFDDAVQAYLDEDWNGCVEGFMRALHGYNLHKRMVINCRRKCKAEAFGATPFFAENIEDLHFYQRKVTETLCLLKCNQDYREIANQSALKQFPREIEQKFVDGRPYEYLHICYYQRKRHQDAANAIFTFLVKHPGHEMSVKNLKYYLTLPDVDEEAIVNLDAPPFLEMYIKGVGAYEREDYDNAAPLLEASLRSYINSEENCRIYCEGPFDQGWHPEFTSSLANHFAYCLKCKRTCPQVLNNVNGEYRRDLLMSHYDYLQFAYYKLSKLKEACAAVESYLLFEPGHETMLHNKEYYSSLPKVKQEYFKPREEALLYVKRQEYELLLLLYISEEFKVVEANFEAFKQQNNSSTYKIKTTNNEKPLLKANSIPTIISPSLPPSSQNHLNLTRILDDEHRDLTKEENNEEIKRKSDIHLVASTKELGGRERYVADGFLNSTECNLMMKLAEIAAIEGDGYEKNKSPHSVHEKFEGVTVGRAALMVYYGLMEPKLLKLFLQKTEVAQRHVQKYFDLHRQLHYTYTHLVCRTALLGAPQNRRDLSHEIHADNCIVNSLGNCSRTSPAYTWRDYSAIVYLNDNFSGGEFFFATNDELRRAASTVRPNCGRMVAFSAGEDNLHGVNGVLRGRRCALALWFTFDAKYYEFERYLAQIILRRVQTVGTVKYEGSSPIPVQYEDVLIELFRRDEILARLLKKST